MKTIISHKTAFYFYRFLRMQENFQIDNFPAESQAIVPANFDTQNLNRAETMFSGLAFRQRPNFLIRDCKKTHKMPEVKFYSSNLKYPINSFIKISDGLYIPSPELLFYQLTQISDYPSLMLAGIEICGAYSMCPDGNQFNKANSITSPKSIKSYLNNLAKLNNKVPNIRKSLNAAMYLGENSYSPQESMLYIMFSSPRHLGGYGIRNLEFNTAVTLSSKAKKICNQEYIFPDISNPKKKIAIEYDSETFHDNSSQNTKDKLRINALQSDGWRVFSFVKSNTYNVNALHQMATDILQANGQEKRINTKNFESKRNDLHRSLYF